MRVFLLAALAGLVGCLPPGNPSSSGKDDALLQDKVLLAGATSSTNWPPDDGGSIHVQANGRSDSQIVIGFTRILDTVPVSGTLHLYRVGPIPALDSVREIALPFTNSDSVVVTPDVILRLDPGGPDTLGFSLRLETDSGNGFFSGFLFSKKDHKFIHSPFSELSTSLCVLFPDVYYLKAIVDTTLLRNASELGGKMNFCFYIPGSPYYWQTGTDSIVLGPLPKGAYPIRYLRISQPTRDPGLTRLESFETEFIPIGNDPNTNHLLFRIRIGEVLSGLDFKGSVQLRPVPK